MVIQRRVWVSGRVQGVGFRASTAEEVRAVFPELRGFVRNLPDGRVEAVFQGEEASVLAMLRWCRQGPSSAQVTQLEVHEEPVQSELTAFGVRR